MIVSNSKKKGENWNTSEISHHSRNTFILLTWVEFIRETNPRTYVASVWLQKRLLQRVVSMKSLHFEGGWVVIISLEQTLVSHPHTSKEGTGTFCFRFSLLPGREKNLNSWHPPRTNPSVRVMSWEGKLKNFKFQTDYQSRLPQVFDERFF